MLVALAPSASLFFVTYDGLKSYTADKMPAPISHMLSAIGGEVAACMVRVPAEVVKQRTQAGFVASGKAASSMANLRYLLQNKSGEGVLRGLYRGWNTTIMREIPFTMIQFPLYEKLKLLWSSYDQRELSLLKGALCGLVAGGFAAAVTTPLDVIKTRVMLNTERVPVASLVRQMLHEEGARVFLNGIGPRTCWISAGGAIFLGCYELVSLTLRKTTALQFV